MITLVKFQHSSKPFWDSFWCAASSLQICCSNHCRQHKPCSFMPGWLISFVTQVRVALDLRLLAARGQTRRQMVISCLPCCSRQVSFHVSSAQHTVPGKLNLTKHCCRLPVKAACALSAYSRGYQGVFLHIFVCNSVFYGSMCLKLWYNILIFIDFKFSLLKISQLLNSFCKLLLNTKTFVKSYCWADVTPTENIFKMLCIHLKL